MIDREHALPVTRQAKLLQISRGSVYYIEAPTSAADLELMREFDRLHLDYPFAGARMLRDMLRTKNYRIGRRHVATLISRCAKAFYLFAVLDWATRRVLAWRISNTLTTDFCIEPVRDAIETYGPPEIFNTDQGSQFTDRDFVTLIRDEHKIALSMDGKGAWRDNVFVERFWKSLKYEEVYLHAYESVSEAKAGIGKYIAFYNGLRPHSSLDGRTPDAVYFTSAAEVAAQLCRAIHLAEPDLLFRKPEPSLSKQIQMSLSLNIKLL